MTHRSILTALHQCRIKTPSREKGEKKPSTANHTLIQSYPPDPTKNTTQDRIENQAKNEIKTK